MNLTMKRCTEEVIRRLQELKGEDNLAPWRTFTRIGQEVGYSRERIRQIAVKEDIYPRPFKKDLTCIDCGGPVSGDNLRCFSCSLKFRNLPNCRCDWCGLPLHRTEKQDHNFCSEACQGYWLGNNYGCGKHAHHQKPRVKVNCAFCGKEIERKKSQVKERNFCSSSCVMKWRIAQGYDIVEAKKQAKERRISGRI